MLKFLQDGKEEMRQVMIQSIRRGEMSLEEYNESVDWAPSLIVTQEEIDNEQ